MGGHLLQVARLGSHQRRHAAAQRAQGHQHQRQHGGQQHRQRELEGQRPVAWQQQAQPARARRRAAFGSGGFVGAVLCGLAQLCMPARGFKALDAGRVVGAQRALELGHRARAFGGVSVERPVDGAQEGLAIDVAPGFDCAGVGLGVGLADFSVGRLLARHGPVQRGTQRVEVGPGPLFTEPVLLRRRVAGRHHHQAVWCHGRGLPSAAKVQQHQAAVAGAHLNIVGLDVSVQEASLVHCSQAIQQRQQQFHQRLLGHRLVLRPPGFERFAVFNFQHHVGRAVSLEETRHAHDGAVPEGRQCARFHQKALQPLLVALQVFAGHRRDHAVTGAKDNVLRQVFLDRHVGVQVHVSGQVGDAEAAFAKHAVDAVLVHRDAGLEGHGQRRLR